MSELISVIVPVYNVKEYLEECIRSIINQTYEDLEIILVDDGSTDGSSEICDEYAARDKRIRIIHKENGGLSSARNVGINHANGLYISFVDSDDWLELDFYKILYEAIKATNADIAACGRYLASESGKLKMHCSDEQRIYSRKEALKEIFQLGSIDVAAWDKLYHRSVIEEIRFPEGEINEDTAVIYEVFNNVKKLVHVGCPLYNYRVRIGSITKSGYSKKFDVVFEHCKKLYRDIEKTDSDLLDDLSVYITHLSYNMLVKIVRSDFDTYKKQFMEYFGIFKTGWISYIKSDRVSKGNKIRCVLLRLHLLKVAHRMAKHLKR
ncbi:MAG: glycosyltransferase family 2 protein [Lachnospiraceae bacterium]